MALLGLQLNLVEGTLTFGWALHVVLYAEGIAVIGGLLAYRMLGRVLLARKRGAYSARRYLSYTPRDPHRLRPAMSGHSGRPARLPKADPVEAMALPA